MGHERHERDRRVDAKPAGQALQVQFGGPVTDDPQFAGGDPLMKHCEGSEQSLDVLVVRQAADVENDSAVRRQCQLAPGPGAVA